MFARVAAVNVALSAVIRPDTLAANENVPPHLALALPLHAQTIFTNDFENDSAGFSSSSRVSLPVDAAGFNSLNASQYLGTFMEESVTLNLTGLTAGATYLVSFDLFIGASWEGRFLCWNQGDRS